MSVDRNKAVVRRFHEELLNQQNLAIASEILDKDIHCYRPAGQLYLKGRDAYLEWTRRCLEVLPDYHIVYSDMIDEGNMVAFRWTVYATDKGGEDWNFGPVAEETKTEWSGIDVFHLADGKIVRYYASAQDEDVRKRLLE